jgi:uracil-DNA glycosylase
MSKEPSWLGVLQPEFKKDYFKKIISFLETEKNAGKKIYPPEEDIFNAFNLTPFNKVKVVIIGQDPYHGAGQAHGLCFSVKRGVKAPPSLKNIYKELQDDIPGIPDLIAFCSFSEASKYLITVVSNGGRSKEY